MGQWAGNRDGQGAESGKGKLQLHPPPTRAARTTPAARGGGVYGRSHIGPRRALVSPNSPVQGELRYGGEHTRVGGGGGLRYTLHAVTHHTPNARTQNYQRVDASIHVS